MPEPVRSKTASGCSKFRLWACLSTSILASSAFVQAAQAQTAPAAPVRSSIDGNGVDLFGGTMTVSAPAVTLGGSGNGLHYQQFNRGSGWSDNTIAFMNLTGTTMIVAIGEASDPFSVASGVYTSTEGNGSTLTYNSTTAIFTYTRADGSVAHFDKQKFNEWNAYGNSGKIVDITNPVGEKLTFGYVSITYCKRWKPGGLGDICTSTGKAWRNSSVASSYGYKLGFVYNYDYTYDPDYPTILPDFTAWSTAVEVDGLNLASSATAVQAVQSIDSTTVPGTLSITDGLSRQTKYRMVAGVLNGITRPGSTSEDVTIGYSSGKVSSITTALGATSYSRSDAGNVRTVTVTDPLSHAFTYLFDIPSQLMTSVTDPLGRTTAMQYDSSARLTRRTEPEGNYVSFTPDARGNITEQRFVAKTSGTPADIVLTAGFDASCTVSVTCNKPNWTKDALGNQTDYTYDTTHGGVLTATAPAAPSGVRPQTRYSYSALQAYYLNGSGSIVASGQTAYRPTAVSTCRTNAAPGCVGTADETVQTISYGPQTAGTGNNLFAVSATVASGDNTLSSTTAVTYDATGNLVSVDGPQAGAADTTAYRYDAIRRPVGVIAPDPDGAGARPNAANRITYDTQGRVTLAEQGTTAGQSDTAWAGFTAAASTASTYDVLDHKLTETLKNGTAAYALTQYSYTADGRVDCAAVRLNPAVYTSLPSSACTAGTAGSFGVDRITKNTYDAAGQTTSVQTAYGTADVSTQTASYSNNGKTAYVIDAQSNRTTYEYDGHDRLVKTRLPVPTAGSNSSSTTDYEQLTLDAASHVTVRRLRDGTTITLAYDNLGRATSLTPQGENVINYQYDLLGRATQVQRPADSATLAYSYDALGHLLSESQPYGSASYQYDAGGRVTRLTWADGFYAAYDYDVMGNVTAIRENGATSGVGVLASYSYDSLGRRTGITRGNGTSTSYAFDAVSRLTSLAQDLAGTSNDLTIGTISYNPARQIICQARSNDAYAWTGHYNVDRSYTLNGLNQATAAGATSLSYDGLGNLTASGSSAYTYSKRNELKTAPGVTMGYDPAGRMSDYNPGSALRFAYAGSALLQEANASGTLLRRYVPGPGTDEPVVWYEGSGTSDRRFLHADERGSVIAVSDSSGTMLAVNRYDEYGIPQSTNVGRFQYTGQAWLPELGMYNYKARIYSPTLGRFMQTDPIGYGDGLNWYGYVHADPVNKTDPTGLKCSDVYCTTFYVGDGGVIWVPGGASRSGSDGTIIADNWIKVTTINIDKLGGHDAPGTRSNGRDDAEGPQNENNPCEGSKSDILDAAETALDYTGSFADAASLGLGVAGVVAVEAPPAAAALEVAAGVAQIISLGAGLTSAGIKAYRGNYVGAVASLGSSAIGRYGARGLGKLANYFGGSLGGKLAREAQATAASQAVGRTQCPK